jgi:hypothetical protein
MYQRLEILRSSSGRKRPLLRIERQRANTERVELESTDLTWAVPTEEAVREVLESLDARVFPTTHVAQVLCKTTTCRVTVEHETRSEARNLRYHFRISGSDVGHKYGTFEESPDGTYLSTIFLTRRGQNPL